MIEADGVEGGGDLTKIGKGKNGETKGLFGVEKPGTVNCGLDYIADVTVVS